MNANDATPTLDDLPGHRCTAALVLLRAMKQSGGDVFILPCRDSRQAQALANLLTCQ
jgi:hypothetical protein